MTEKEKDISEWKEENPRQLEIRTEKQKKQIQIDMITKDKKICWGNMIFFFSDY